MVLNEFFPSPFLKEFIRVYRVVQCSFTNNLSTPFKPYPPRPEHCLSFYPKDTETVEYSKNGTKIANLKSVLFGQQTEVTNRHVGNDFLLFQVVFKPGALYRLTKIPSNELTNCYIDATSIFSCGDIDEVNERLADASSFRIMVPIVESFLTKQLHRNQLEAHRLDNITNLILHTADNVSIEWLAKEACLSLRQFERKFIERMGVTPIYFNKVVRFENAFRMKNKYPTLDWLTIAIHCGFYDYQHLVKNYREFTLQTPTEFHLLDLASPERKFGEADTY